MPQEHYLVLHHLKSRQVLQFWLITFIHAMAYKTSHRKVPRFQMISTHSLSHLSLFFATHSFEQVCLALCSAVISLFILVCRHITYDFVSSVLMAWGLIGPVLIGLGAVVAFCFSSTLSWQIAEVESVTASGALFPLSPTFCILPPGGLLCCCSEKNLCVDWMTSALCLALIKKDGDIKQSSPKQP